ncbi:MAG TPA: ferrochelatase [Candidatus Binatia bacterium]|nr:ferrochelatase [Candidatus Binatia bacterium]
MSLPYDAVLLIAFGGPEKIEDVRPFLANVTKGRPVPPQRLEEVIHHYEAFNGRSPLNKITFRQARALQRLLDQEGPRLPVYVGMRNWQPYFRETLAQMARDRVRHALGVILSAQQSEAGWDRYKENIEVAREQVGAHAPVVEYTPSWYDHPLFIEAVADLTRQAFDQIPTERREQAPLVFTAHSVPATMPGTVAYVQQIETGAHLVAAKIGHTQWSVTYQSRSGDPRTPWLEPDLGVVLPQLAAEGAHEVVVVPLGFVCDHVEVLYDLDIEARQIAVQHGLNLIRVGTVNDHPTFIRMLADVVRTAVS